MTQTRLYWILTVLAALAMGVAGIMYLVGVAQGGGAAEGFAHLGYPAYFPVLLGVAKILGALALVVPATPPTLREWAYAGFTFTLLGAAVSHLAAGDGVGTAVPPLIALAVVLGSYVLWHRRRVGQAVGDAPVLA